MARIDILSGNHLCHAPRVIKEAETLAQAGHEVRVLGAWFDRRLKERDRRILQTAAFAFVPVVDCADGNRWTVSVVRARGKFASVAHRVLGAETRLQLGRAYSALRRDALRGRADLYIAHSEAGMAIAAELMQRGRPVGVDIEDWFSEDLLPAARRNRPLGLLRRLEGRVLGGARFASCPSQAMSRALAEAYACAAPIVLYNAFRWRERSSLDGLRKDRRDEGRPSVHWFSQTLGLGRGLEDVIAALPLLEHDAEIHLRGNLIQGFDRWVRARAPQRWRDKIFFHPLVPNDELLSRIAEHDIGFAGEMKYCHNKELTISNKILQYLLAGLAVVASDTAGQTEVAEQAPHAVSLYRSGDPVELAARLNALLESPDKLRAARTAALQAAERVFCWERQENTLLQAVDGALCTADRTRAKRA